MAWKRKKRKKSKSVRTFWITLMLTIAIGNVVMFGSWAASGLDDQAAAALARSVLEKVIGGGTVPGKENGTSQVNASGISDFGQSDTAQQQEAGIENTDFGLLPENDGAGQGQHEEGGDAAEAAAAVQPETDIPESAYAEEGISKEDKIYAKETADPGEISIVFAGDILFDDNYAIMARMKQRGGTIESSISADMLQVMRSADIFMVNNEFPYSDRGEPTPDKTFTFRGRPEYASYLLDMGADIVSLANNHASDYGTVSLTDTIDVLNGIGMPFVGAGRNLEEAVKPVCFVANGMKIAILSATQIERMENPATKGATDSSPGVFRCLNIDRLLQEIRKAKENSDFVIAYIHWGTESTDEIDWAQKEQGPKIAEAGADLIIGDHPHVLQPVGYCGNVPVIYSLGNYLFNSRAQDTCLVRAVVTAEGLKSLQFIPGRQENCSVTMHYGAEKERVLAYMRSISPGVNIDADGYITKQ